MSAAPDYRTLLERLDSWSTDAAARHPGVIPCKSGCTACCHGPFDISAADAALLREGVAALDPVTQAEVRSRGEFLLARMKGIAPEWEAPWEIEDVGEDRFDEITDALEGEACPLLDAEGRCVVYAHRPAICRMMGLGMRTAQGNVENACPIQHQFPEYAKLPPQPFDLAAFEREEERFIAKAKGGETTIAGVVGDVRRET